MERIKDQDGVTPVGWGLVLGLVMTILMVGTIHYSLKNQEEAGVQRLVAQAQEASERKVLAVSREFATLGGGLLQTDLYRIQKMLQAGLRQEGLVDAVVVDLENMIVASKDTSRIGHNVPDVDSWNAWRAQNQEIVSRATEHVDYLLMTVIEPMKEKDETLAWLKMTYSLSKPEVSVRSSAERAIDTVIFVGPLVFVLLIGLYQAVRSAQARVDNMTHRMALLTKNVENMSRPVTQLKKAS
jgi:hypothetical protein